MLSHLAFPGPVVACGMLVAPHLRKYYNLALLFVVAVTLLTVWLPSYNALTDYPNHLVRTYILAYYDSSPAYQRLFDRSMLPIPNMAIDYLVTPLVRSLGMVAAGKVFLSLLTLLFIGGCHRLGAAIHGSPSWSSLGCSMLVFYGAYQYGFVNYCFSVSLLLVSLAWWYGHRNNWKVLSLGALCLLFTALFVSHLAGFGVACLTLAFFWVRELFAEGRLAKRTFMEAATQVPAFAIWLSHPKGHGVTMHSTVIQWPTLFGKVASAFTLFRSGNNTIDVLFGIGVFAFIILSIRHTESRAKPFLQAGIFLFCVFLVVPPKFLVDSSGADVRIVIPALLLILMSLHLPAGRMARWVGLSLLALLGVRLLWQFDSFLEAASVTENIVRLTDQVPARERFWMVCENERIFRQNSHAGDYGLARKGAISSNYIAFSFQQPLWYRVPVKSAEELPDELTASLVETTLKRFAYAIACTSEDRSDVLRPYASPVATAGRCSLWKTRTY